MQNQAKSLNSSLSQFAAEAEMYAHFATPEWQSNENVS